MTMNDIPAYKLLNMPEETRYGYCKCGCGLQTTIAAHTDNRCGWVKGEPIQWIIGHQSRTRIKYLIDEETGCWVWQLKPGIGGYGDVKVGRTTRKAHVLMYNLFRGEVPKGLQLDHLCRNRLCVNPYHLEPVTPAENKRRGVGIKLNPETVLAIRTLHKSGMSSVRIARELNLPKYNVYNVTQGRTWKEFTV